MVPSIETSNGHRNRLLFGQAAGNLPTTGMIVLRERTDWIAGTIIEACCETCGTAMVSWHDHDQIDLTTAEKHHRCPQNARLETLR